MKSSRRPTAHDGIEKARKELPDLILCDINMGKVDGYLTLASLRNEAPTAAIPFILMTGLADNAGHAARHGTGRGRLSAQAVHDRGALRRRGGAPEKGPDRPRRGRAQTRPFARQHQPDDAARDAHAAQRHHVQRRNARRLPPPRSKPAKSPRWARKFTSPASGSNGSSKIF